MAKYRFLLALSASSAALCASLVLLTSEKKPSAAASPVVSDDAEQLAPLSRSPLRQPRAPIVPPTLAPAAGLGRERMDPGPDRDLACDDPEECETAEDDEAAAERTLERPALDSAVDDAPPDVVWSREVMGDLQRALEVWPGARVDEARCSARLCRATFSATSAFENVEELFDRINTIPAVAGERLVEIDMDAVPAVAVAYFSRGGSISLSDYAE